MVRNPAFKQEEIDRQRQQAVSGLKVSFEDPDFVASVVFDRLVYGFHPYGMPGSGTPESLQSITAADLHAFHQRYYAPNNAILAVVGDVTAEEAFAGAERVFGNWAKRDVPPVRVNGTAGRDAPPRHRQQARRGADRDPRRATSASNASTRTTSRWTWR